MLDERGEARLIAEASSPAPDGRERWMLPLLADRIVELEGSRLLLGRHGSELRQ